MVVLVVLSAATLPARAASQSHPGAERTARDAQLSELYQRFLDGIRGRDSAWVGALLTPDYINAQRHGRQQRTRAERLRAIAEDHDPLQRLQLERCQFEHGSAQRVQAVCTVDEQGIFSGRPEHYRVEAVVGFRRMGDRWAIASTKTSILQKLGS